MSLANLFFCLTLATAPLHQQVPPAQPREAQPPSQRPAPRPKDHTIRPISPPERPADPKGIPAPPVAPPFVPHVGVVLQGNAEPPGKLPPPYHSGSTQWVVETGTSWRLFADKIKPGDEILFTAWFHIPQDFDGLEGTAERPIIIRSRDAQPAAIACEDFGFRFNRPRHVVVENLLFLNAVDAAIQVDGAPLPGAPADSSLGKPEPAGWNADVVIRNCTVAGTRALPSQDAIRLNNVQNVRVDSVRVDGWNDCALEMLNARRILVRGLMMVPIEKHMQARGIAVLGASADVSINACSFNKGLADGVMVGTAGLPDSNGTTAVPPAERVRVDRCVFDRVGNSIVIANARDFTVNRITVVDPLRSIYCIPDDAGIVERVLIEKSLASWPPGKLAKFSPHPDRISPTGITLGDNLWFSAELPAAFEAIGAPFGYQAAAQILDVNPLIDLTTMRPQSMDGIRYGALSIATSTSTAQEVGPNAPPAPPRPKFERGAPPETQPGAQPDAPAAPPKG